MRSTQRKHKGNKANFSSTCDKQIKSIVMMFLTVHLNLQTNIKVFKFQSDLDPSQKFIISKLDQALPMKKNIEMANLSIIL